MFLFPKIMLKSITVWKDKIVSFFPKYFIYLAALGLSCSIWVFSWQHVESSFQTRYWTQAPCIGSSNSYLLDHQGSPWGNIFFIPKNFREGVKRKRGSFLPPEFLKWLTLFYKRKFKCLWHTSSFSNILTGFYKKKNYPYVISIESSEIFG